MATRKIGVQTVVARTSLDQIGVWVLEGHFVYPAESTTPDARSKLFQVKANCEVPIGPGLLQSCRNAGINELTVVVIPKTITVLGSHRAHYIEALEIYEAEGMATPDEALKKLRAKVHELVMLYQLCADFLEKIGHKPQHAGLLDPELAGFVRQLADRCLYVYKMAKVIVDKYFKVDSKIMEAIKGLASLDNKEARLGLECALEVLDLTSELRQHDTKYTIERLAGGFLASIFLRIALWGNNKGLADFAARGAEIYNELRRQNPELPDIAFLIEYHDKATPQTPYAYEINVTTANRQETCLMYRFHARPDAKPIIQNELKQTYIAAGYNPLPEFTVEPVNDNKVMDLICLYLASRVTRERNTDNSPAQIIAEISREISMPCAELDLDEALMAKPSLFARILGALAQAHGTIPIGAVISLYNRNPAFLQASQQGGLDHGVGVYLGDGIWFFSHPSQGEKILPPPDLDALTEIYVSTCQRRQGLIPFSNEMVRRRYENHSTVMRILAFKVLQRLVRRYKKQLLEYLPPINL